MRSLSFMAEFMKYPTQVGTCTQSSKTLSRKIAEEINGSSTVVEFGPGTGTVTREILKRLPEKGRLICFEINPKFCRQLDEIRDPRLRVINDDAQNCHRYIPAADCIVSGLPLALFAKSKKRRILDITSRSKRYVQLQYTPLLSKEMKSYFPNVKMKFVPQNLPPALIFVCQNGGK